MLRISGGIYRSRVLKTPDTNLTKPTMDRVRAGVFSALQNDIENKTVLDLFAGSGSYGFESLSRGARYVTFIDDSVLCTKIIKENAHTLEVMDKVNIIKSDAFSFLRNNNQTYDIIFVDPPYKKYDYKDILKAILETNALNENGIIVLESDYVLDVDTSRFAKIKEYKYSETRILVLRS